MLYQPTHRRVTCSIQTSPQTIKEIETGFATDPSILRHLVIKKPDIWKDQNKLKLCKRALVGRSVQDLTPVSSLPVPSLRIDLTPGIDKNSVIMDKTFVELDKKDLSPTFFYSEDVSHMQKISTEIFGTTGAKLIKQQDQRLNAADPNSTAVYTTVGSSSNLVNQMIDPSQKVKQSDLSSSNSSSDISNNEGKADTIDNIIGESDKKQQYFFLTQFRMALKNNTTLGKKNKGKSAKSSTEVLSTTEASESPESAAQSKQDAFKKICADIEATIQPFSTALEPADYERLYSNYLTAQNLAAGLKQ